MKVHVVHDQAGNIRAAFIPVAKKRAFLLRPGPDRTVAEVDIPEITLALSPETQEKAAQLLHRVLSNSRIVSGRLIREDKPGT